MFKLFNILDYTNIVIGQVQAVDQYNAWARALQSHSHYYNMFVVEVK